MGFSFTFGGEPQDLTIILTGRADVPGLRRLNEALTHDPRFRAGLAILVDTSDLDVSGLTAEAIEVITEPVVERDWSALPLAEAIVAPNEATSATAALYRAFLGGSRSRRAIFASHEEATAWLREQREQADG
jgi:hypothetical protein